MGSGSSQSQTQQPGTLSPVTATLINLFGGNSVAAGGQFQPSSFGGTGSSFLPESFAALPGMLQNQPLSANEQFILGAGQTGGGQPVFDAAGFQQAVQDATQAAQPTGIPALPPPNIRSPLQLQQFYQAQGLGGTGAVNLPNVNDYLSYTEPTTSYGVNPGFADLATLGALQGQNLLNQTAENLPLSPDAAVAQARRSFEQDTLPAILERAPGFSSSDLQRELTRAGTDLETNVRAMRDAYQLQLAQTMPAFAQALGTNLLDQGSQILGFGQFGRELIRDTSAAGDAFRTLTALQSLTGPALSTYGIGKSKSTGVL